MKRLSRWAAGRWLLLAGPLALAACQRPEEPPVPADLLPKEQVVSLLADLHILESQLEGTRLSPDSARALYLTQQKQLLWQREISDSTFHRSYRYYSIHGQDLDDIYGLVIDTLRAREFRMGAQEEQPKK